MADPSATAPGAPSKRRLLERVQEVGALKHYSGRTVDAYVATRDVLVERPAGERFEHDVRLSIVNGAVIEELDDVRVLYVGEEFERVPLLQSAPVR